MKQLWLAVNRRADIRWGVALALVLGSAICANLLLWPRAGVINPASVNVRDYFDQAFVNRAESFRSTGSFVALAGMLTQLAVLVAIGWRWHRLVATRMVTAAVVAASMATAVLCAGLPFDAWNFDRAREFGLATQSWAGWSGDWLLAYVLVTVGAALLGTLIYLVVRYFRSFWWILMSAATVALSVVLLIVWPVAIDPLFANFSTLNEPRLRAQIEDLAAQAQVEVDKVLVVDASARTTAANAYVAGLGGSKRVVLYDTLIADFSPDQVKQVVAHELGHVHHRDIARAIAWLALFAPVAFFAVSLATGAGRQPPAQVGLPPLFMAIVLAALVGSLAANSLSRQVELRADSFAVRLTNDPKAAIKLEVALTKQNLSRPEPPWLLHQLFGTHPTAAERIGLAQAVARR